MLLLILTNHKGIDKGQYSPCHSCNTFRCASRISITQHMLLLTRFAETQSSLLMCQLYSKYQKACHGRWWWCCCYSTLILHPEDSWNSLEVAFCSCSSVAATACTFKLVLLLALMRLTPVKHTRGQDEGRGMKDCMTEKHDTKTLSKHASWWPHRWSEQLASNAQP